MCVQTTEMLEEAIRWSRVAEEETFGGAETILFVEDEAFVRDVTCEVLQSAGYRVLTAKNAAEAMRLYSQSGGEVELLLSDVVLPGETGRALACKLRRENPLIKILLVTGYAEQMGLRQAEPEELLAKPFSTETLLRRMRQLLDRSGLRIGTQEVVRHVGDNA
jgi:two-component system cell cycle sensor histidine kinase/response regulator CckA